jgi:hypothetical protein
MAGFGQDHGKKIEQLNKREQKLRRLIGRGAAQNKLLQAALEVRDGRICVLRARRNKAQLVLERESPQAERAAIEALRALSAEAVLAEYLSG